MRGVRVVAVLCLIAAASPPARAVITFTQLADDVFVVSHRIKVVGSRGRAMKMVYTKAASLCLAAGYSHFKILEQESQAGQQHDAANASVQVQYFHATGEGRLECKKNSDPEYIEEARKKLARKGYEPTAPAAGQLPTAPAPDASGSESCTVEQIVAMVNAGLTEEQIKAACPDR